MQFLVSGCVYWLTYMLIVELKALDLQVIVDFRVLWEDHLVEPFLAKGHALHFSQCHVDELTLSIIHDIVIAYDDLGTAAFVVCIVGSRCSGVGVSSGLGQINQ